MEFTYRPRGVCSSLIKIETEGSKVNKVEIVGGCNGNSKGIASLVTGMEIDDVIARLEGIQCGYKPTSCPDQLAQALKALKAEQ